MRKKAIAACNLLGISGFRQQAGRRGAPVPAFAAAGERESGPKPAIGPREGVRQKGLTFGEKFASVCS